MIIAIKDKVITKILTREKSAGGIFLSSTTQDPQTFCEIISIGEEVISALKVGDIIVCHPRGGMDLLINKTFIKVLKQDEVYGILTDEVTISCLKAVELGPSTPENSISSLIKGV